MEKRAGRPKQADQDELTRREGEKAAKELQLAKLTAQRKKLEHARDMRLQLDQTREKNRALEQMIAEKKALMAHAQQKEPQVTEEQKEIIEVEEVVEEQEIVAVVVEKEGAAVEEEDNSGAATATAEMSDNINKITGAVPKQQQKPAGGKKQKHGGRSPAAAMMMAARLQSPATPSGTPARLLSPEPATSSITTNDDDNNSASRLLSPEPTADQGDGGEESQHADISAAVRRIEGKCASVKGNLADMAMSEQYLRTKQAMLLAKKKEQEMQIAENIAKLREAEVIKMREKVKHMQVTIPFKYTHKSTGNCCHLRFGACVLRWIHAC